jgi:DNA mismatch repair protein MutS
MMRQFYDLKAKHPDALLLFRCGDFYETYAEDAVTAADVLGITLTRRNNGKENMPSTEMAGFPYHALETYLPKLVRAGMRVAICDQLEDPKLTKKLVKRGITELVTPGVVQSDVVLEAGKNNFLAAVHFGGNAIGVSFFDISTGEFLVSEGAPEHVRSLLSGYNPKEVLFERGRRDKLATLHYQSATFEMDDWAFSEQTAKETLCRHFKVKNLKGFGIDHMRAGIVAAGVVMQYLEMTQHTQLRHVTHISRIETDKYVRLDKFTIRSLELVSTMGEGGISLREIIDQTVTPMGGRMLVRWILFPLKDPKAIDERLDVVEELFRNPDLRDEIYDEMRRISDMERIVGKINTGRVTPRDLLALASSLEAWDVVLRMSEGRFGLNDDEGKNALREVSQMIRQHIVPEPPGMMAKSGFIRDGVDKELDTCRQIAFHGKEYLLEMQQREIEKTGIQSLKVGFNNVFGYYLEVRNTYRSQVPAEWIRKQTLVSAERYITEELKSYEEKIVTAQDKMESIEARIFMALVSRLAQYTEQIQRSANEIARLDCLLSFALTAGRNRYVRPVVETSDVLDIHGGRHPVIEQQLPAGERYVANDTYLSSSDQQIIIITGPNMAGKSALLRQTALITLMAQVGCFVPAGSADIGVVDRIFTRVGASDDLSSGQSTFMVEMNEVANILRNATKDSLLILDEIGRGTSTFDGLSIAWAVVEHISNKKLLGAKTLFATHYHELTELEGKIGNVHNYCIAVKEKGDDIVFLRKIVKGGADKSYGIQVAKLAGVPAEVTDRAAQIVMQLLDNDITEKIQQIAVGTDAKKHEPVSYDEADLGQMSFFDTTSDEDILKELGELEITTLTPLDALNTLYHLQSKLKNRYKG